MATANVQYINGPQDAQLAAQQDLLRSMRQFVSTMASTAFGDEQIYADTDAYATNYPGQYTTYSPAANATAVEGRPASWGLNAPLQISPMLLILGGLAIAFLVKR